jgi:Zn-dependent protease
MPDPFHPQSSDASAYEPLVPAAEAETSDAYPELMVRHAGRVRPRYWLHLLLLLFTLLTTTIVGARLNYNFVHDLPIFGSGEGADADAFPMRWVLQHPHELEHGIPFSLCLLAFFMAHEMGHYAYCRRHRVNASLPYFIPFPTLIGTFGAVIRIRAPFRSRRILFDIGVAGPIAGMLVAVPLVAIGLLLSKAILPSAIDKDVIFGTPLVVSLLAQWMPGLHVPAQLASVQPHPVLLAGWVGVFATALNLVPGGQLDGGHILYSVSPRVHAALSRLVAVGLLLLGMFAWVGWVIWGLVLLLPWFRHPYVEGYPPLSRTQKWVAVLALVLFLLTFNPVPFHQSSAWDIYRQWRAGQL